MNLEFIPKDELPQHICETAVATYGRDLHRATCTCQWVGTYWSRADHARSEGKVHEMGRSLWN